MGLSLPFANMGGVHTRRASEIKKGNKGMRNEFNRYALSEEILEALKGLGYKEPTSIQREVILPMLAGRNVVVKAPTGSGHRVKIRLS